MIKEVSGIHEVIDELLNGIPKFVLVIEQETGDAIGELNAGTSLSCIAEYTKDMTKYKVVAYEEPCPEFDVLSKMYRHLYLDIE